MEDKVIFYVDVYFILNFIMNLFLAFTLALWRQKNCHILRLFFVSVVYALLDGIGTLYFKKQMVFLTFVEIFSFSLVAFGKNTIKGWIADTVSLLGLSFLTGGTLLALRNFMQYAGIVTQTYSFYYLFFGVIVLFFLFWIFRFEVLKQTKMQQTNLRAKIIHHGKEYHIHILCDTGNQLISPYTGENVMVISEDFSKEIGLTKEQNPILIPYHSIGGDGMLKAYRLDGMIIEGEQKKEHILVAVSCRLGTQDNIKMIINRIGM